jgi:glutaredoxin-related protein
MKPGSKFNIDDFIKENINSSEVLSQFKGTISEKKSDRIIDNMEGLFGEQEVRIRKRILLAASEILQNMYMHNEYPLYPAVFLATRTRQGFKIDCGNAVSITRRTVVEKRIREANRKAGGSMKENVRQADAEKPVIAENPNGSSGLGLLEIRRKAGMPLDFAFTIIDNETFFFHLIVKFNMGE